MKADPQGQVVHKASSSLQNEPIDTHAFQQCLSPNLFQDHEGLFLVLPSPLLLSGSPIPPTSPTRPQCCIGFTYKLLMYINHLPFNPHPLSSSLISSQVCGILSLFYLQSRLSWYPFSILYLPRFYEKLQDFSRTTPYPCDAVLSLARFLKNK